jgi:hypothetical protein
LAGDCSFSAIVLKGSQFVLSGVCGSVIGAALGPVIAYYVNTYI